ncbi:uncharacterized protein LOC106535019, partial [Austrofundulus limnaeus]|uniref:Uncharacterized protein LOC106535019 n=1 Tax=Austrofundulus limnaeus TaxID=52670 RepID=A0A2I4D500_AUSLI
MKRPPSMSSSERQLFPKKDKGRRSLIKSVTRSLKIQKEPSTRRKIDKLTKQCLENPAVRSVANHYTIKEAIALVVPVLMDELAKDGASSPSSSSGVLTSKSCSSSSSSRVEKGKSKLQKNKGISSSKPKFDKPSPPTMLKLKGKFDSLCHNDVVSAVEVFGKTKSVLLMKPKQEATVCFENKEDAEKLRKIKSLRLKDVVLTVSEMGGVFEKAPPSTEDQKQSFQQKSAVTNKSGSSKELVLLPFETLISLPAKHKKSPASKPTKKANVATSKGKDVTKQTKGIASVKRAVKRVEGEKASKPVGSKKLRSLVKNPGSGSVKPATKIAKKRDEDSAVRLKKTTNVEKVFSVFGSKQVKGTRTVIRAKSRALKTLKGFRTKELTEKTTMVSSESTALTQAEGSGIFKLKNLDSRVQVEPEDLAKQTRVVTKSEKILQIELTADSETIEDKDKTVELEKTGVTEPEKAKGSAEDVVKNLTAEKILPVLTPTSEDATEPNRSLIQPPQTQQTTPETSLEDAPQVQPNLDSTAKKPNADTKTGQDLTAESSPKAAFEEVLTTGNVETKTNQEETSLVLEPVCSYSAAAAPTTKPGSTAASTAKRMFSGTTFANTTVGERIQWYCEPQKFNCVMAESILSDGRWGLNPGFPHLEPFSIDSTLLLITNLPDMIRGHYTESDIVNLLSPYGFRYEHDNIYVMPQKFMAFALMPNELSMLNIIRASANKRLVLGTHELILHIVKKNILMTPLGFYNSLMELTPLSGVEDGTSLIYIRDISPNEMDVLKEVLQKIGCVTNFLPLLNKVFIEFLTDYDADRLGVCYSFMKKGFFHILERIKLPRSSKRAKPPKLAMSALPDRKDIIPGSQIPNAKYGIPQGTVSPFWITMTTNPYIFSTAAPWFNIPDFLTIQQKQDITTTLHPGSVYSTVMLTGLPEGRYKHEDVARLLWPYFPQRNLQTLYYNILVLPLQRRAFVYFSDRETCCSFVRDHVKKPFSVGNCALKVHFVLQDMRYKPSEEIMYRTFMKWSNAHVPKLEFLEKRLLCLELSETSADLVSNVMKEVASIGCFINFLPLANRICIEMVESRCVQNVLELVSLKQDLSTHKTWSKVRHVESLNLLKQRLKDTSKIMIDLGNTSDVCTKPPVVIDEPHESPQCSYDEWKSKIKFKIKPLDVSRSALKTIANPLDDSRTEINTTTNPPDVSRSEIKTTTIPLDISRSEINTTTNPPDVSRSEIKTTTKPPDVSETEIKTTTNFQNVSRSEIKTMTNLPNVSRSEIKTTTNPPNVSRSEVKTTTKPVVSRSEIKTTTKPPDVSKTEVKTTTNFPNISRTEIKMTKPPDVLRSEMKTTTKPPDVSRTEIMTTTNPPNVSRSEIKTMTNFPNISRSEIKTTTKPPNVSGTEIKTMTNPPHISRSEIKTTTNPPNDSRSEIKTTTKPPDVSGTEIKTATNPPHVSRYEIKTTTNPPNVSRTEIKTTTNPPVSRSEIKTTTNPPDVSRTEIKTTTNPPVVSTFETKLEKRSAEPINTVLTCTAETTTVSSCPPSEETSASAGLLTVEIETNSTSDTVNKTSALSTELSAPAKKDPTTINEIKKLPSAAASLFASSAAVDSSLTVGEEIESLLPQYKILALSKKIKGRQLINLGLVLITNLPSYHDGCYTEKDVASLFYKFGFIYENDHIYVIPQKCVAFVLMPNRGKARDVCVASQKKLFTLKGSQLYAKIVRIEFSMAPFEFYKSLMEMIEFKVSDDKERTIYIRNISPSEVRNLREELKKIQSVKNVFPLLNKVFVEFENPRDADRIGVWYSLQKHSPPHNIFRMRVPWSTNVAMAPRLAAKALPDAKDLVTGAVVPTTNCGVPKGSKPPFSVTLTTYPFVFPTVSPWFIIPNFVTAELKCQNWRYFMETKHPMVMLTGLPSGNYKHKDVVKLVWQYLPKQNLQCLYYNVLVLPLQRRAFVFFKDRQSCCSFVEDYLKNPVPVEGHVLDIHIVKQVVDPGSTEESMYRTLMKWSNSHVPDLESLQERLVIVELSETSVSLIIAVMKSVTQVAPFVSFLPLANRICIEMTESSGVTRVIKKIQSQQWSKVRHAESSKSLNQRIQQFGEISVNLDLENYVLTLNPIKATTHKPEPPLAETADVQEAAAESKGPSSAAQMPQICNEKTELAAAKTIDVPSELAGSEKQPDAPVKVQDSEVVPAETVKVESKEAKPSELMETAVTEQTELEGSVETKGETTAETKPLQTKPSESQTTPTPAPSTDPQRPQTTFKPQETPAKSSSEVQKSLPNSDTTHLKPKTDTSQKQQQTAEESGPVSEKSQTSEINNEASSAKEVAAGSSELDPNQQSATVGNETTANETTSAPVVVSTPKESSQNFHTITKNIQFLSLKNILLPKFLSKEICLIVTNLPEYNDGSYTESSIINLLRKFGLEFEDDSVFIAPQYQTAFVCQPHVRKVQEFFKRPISNNRTLNGSKLCFQVFCVQKYTLFGFYTFFMNVTSSKRKHTSSSVVYIK